MEVVRVEAEESDRGSVVIISRKTVWILLSGGILIGKLLSRLLGWPDITWIEAIHIIAISGFALGIHWLANLEKRGYWPR
jgi:hypothetical protein